MNSSLLSENFKLGVGLRHKHFPYFEMGNTSVVDFFEIISENFINTKGRPFEILMRLRQDYAVCMHGVSLSIASTEPVDLNYLKKLKDLINVLEPMIVSDHLCFTGNKEFNLHNLLPFSYTESNLKRITEKVKTVQDYLNRQLVLENLSAYFSLKSSEMSEGQFLNELCKLTGCGVLLDINNLYVNSINQKFSTTEFLENFNFENVKQFHLAGYTDFGEYLFDTHAMPVHPPVWDLYKKIIKMKNDVPVLIEWDEDIPEFEILENEAWIAKKLAEEVFRNG
jgi:uncharacterized protein (UPF0276 family)